MTNILHEFVRTFVPIFVAVDAIGILPVVLSLTEGLTEQEMRAVVRQSMLAAVISSVGFAFFGSAILDFLGIQVTDFMIAGGIVLFVLSLTDVLFSRSRRRMDYDDIGIVPIGTPLIAGPAVLTTTLILSHQYGYLLTSISLVLNILIAGALFLFAGRVILLIGGMWLKVLSKIAGLILAAYAIMLVRRGFEGIFLK